MDNNTPTISILVPIYKVEKYLSRCIESVLSQSFTDYELILVDDGSPDNCPQICDEYATKDSRIKVIHKKNGGLVSARLAGFEASKGGYIVFLDSDDYLLPDALTILYNKIKEGYDIVKAFPLRVTSDNKQWIEHYEFEEGEIDTTDKYVEYLILNKIAPYLHSGIYKASLFDTRTFQDLIQQKISIGEDWIMNYCIALNVHKLFFMTESVYVYYLNEESMINSMIKSWDYIERIHKATDRTRKQLPEHLKKLESNVSIINRIRNFFIPELKFNFQKFKQIQSGYHNAINYLGRNAIDKKYCFLIDYTLLFYIYTHLFRLAFWVLKLKCKSRRILS